MDIPSSSSNHSQRKRKISSANHDHDSKRTRSTLSMYDDHSALEITEYKRRRVERIDEVLATVAKTMPLYKNVIGKFLNDVLYDGPPMHLPSASVSSELLCAIFGYLNRNELEKCQLISRSWKSLVDQHSDYLPLHSFYKFKIEKLSHRTDSENCMVEGSIYSTNSKMILAIVYKPNEQDHNRVSAMRQYLRPLKNVVFQFIELQGIRMLNNEEEQPMESDLQLMKFMDIVKEMSGGPLRIQFCPLFIGYLSAVTDMFLQNYIKAYKVYIPFDTFLQWLYTNKEVDYDPYTKKVKIYVDPDLHDLNEPDLMDTLLNFIKNAKVQQPQIYRICLNSGWLQMPSFYEKWIEFYTNATDPMMLINKFNFYNRRRFLDTRFNIFASMVIEFYRNQKKKVQKTIKKSYNYLVYTIDIKKLANGSRMMVELQFDVDAFEANRYDQYQEFVKNVEEPDIEKLELSYFRKIKFFVDV